MDLKFNLDVFTFSILIYLLIKSKVSNQYYTTVVCELGNLLDGLVRLDPEEDSLLTSIHSSQQWRMLDMKLLITTSYSLRMSRR